MDNWMDQIGRFQFEPDAPERLSRAPTLQPSFFVCPEKGFPTSSLDFESFIPRGKGWVRINESVRVRHLLIAHSIAAVLTRPIFDQPWRRRRRASEMAADAPEGRPEVETAAAVAGAEQPEAQQQILEEKKKWVFC